MQRLTRLAAGFVLAAWSHGVVADAWIESFAGDADGYRITRGSEPVRAAILATLQPGDVIDVVAPSGEIVLVYQTGENVEIRSGDAPHTVRGTTEAPSAFQNLMRWSMETIKGWYEKDYEMTTAAGVNTRSTVSQITFPLFRGEGSWVAARPTIEFAWNGGLPPYKVQLQRIDDIVPPLRFDASGTTLTLDDLPAGDYVLTVDDGWRRGSAKFAVVGAERIPAAPVDGGAASDRIHQVIEAMWLAQYEQGGYTLEAYQRLNALDADYPPVEVAKNALLRGLSPQEPSAGAN